MSSDAQPAMEAAAQPTVSSDDPLEPSVEAPVTSSIAEEAPSSDVPLPSSEVPSLEGAPDSSEVAPEAAAGSTDPKTGGRVFVVGRNPEVMARQVPGAVYIPTSRLAQTWQRPFLFSHPVSGSPLSPAALPLGPALLTSHARRASRIQNALAVKRVPSPACSQREYSDPAKIPVEGDEAPAQPTSSAEAAPALPTPAAETSQPAAAVPLTVGTSPLGSLVFPCPMCAALCRRLNLQRRLNKGWPSRRDDPPCRYIRSVADTSERVVSDSPPDPLANTCEERSRSVTLGHARSRSVTLGHGSRSVTLLGHAPRSRSSVTLLGHPRSPSVTLGHSRSLSVTLGHARSDS
eukprot:1183305-Prorocentrum_minimum.AAC.4